jgi:hypothetical protein
MESTHRFPQSLEIASRFPHSTQADGYTLSLPKGKIIVANRKKCLTSVSSGDGSTLTALPGMDFA